MITAELPTIHLIQRHHRKSFLPDCPASRAFAENKFRTFLNLEDINCLRKMGFAVNLEQEKEHKNKDL